MQNSLKIEDKEQLIDWFKTGFKEKKEWMVEQSMKSLHIHFQKIKINMYLYLIKEK